MSRNTCIARVAKPLALTTAGLAAFVVCLAPVQAGESPENSQTAEEVTKQEATVVERAQSRWDALLAGEFEDAYAYASPAYRSATPFTRYRARLGGAVQWTQARVTDADCGDGRCTVSVDLSYRIPREGIEHTRPIRETWLKSEDNWWIAID